MYSNLCSLSRKEKCNKHKLLVQQKQIQLQLENTLSNLVMYSGCIESCLNH